MSYVEGLKPRSVYEFLKAAIPDVMTPIERNHLDFVAIGPASEQASDAGNDAEVERLSRKYSDEAPLHSRNQDTLALLKQLAVQVAASQHLDMSDDIARTKRDITDLKIVDPEVVEAAFKRELGQGRAA